MLAKTTFTGTLVKDPELGDFNGTPFCNFTVAKNKKYKEKQETCFMDCVAWGKPAEIIAQYMKKGEYHEFSCDIKQQTWDDKATGAKRSKIVFNVTEFDFGRNPKKEETPFN